MKPTPPSPAVALVLVVGKVQSEAQVPFHFLKVSPTLSCTPKDAHPGLLQSRGAAGAAEAAR